MIKPYHSSHFQIRLKGTGSHAGRSHFNTGE